MMKSVRQMLRQPLKYFLGIILIALAVAVLCVCLGQSFAASVAKDELNDKFVTIAMPSDTYTKEADDWIVQYTKNGAETVKEIASTGLASAYINGLVPDNFTDYQHYENNEGFSYKPYDLAVLEITVKDVHRSVSEDYTVGNSEEQENPASISYELISTIDSVIALQEGYSNPVGFTAKISLTVDSVEEFEALGIISGEKYLVYCDGYTDLDYLLRNELSNNKKVGFFDAFNHDKYEPFRSRYGTGAKIRYGDLITAIYGRQLDMYRTVTASLAGVDTPTIARLDADAKEYLESSSGERWKEYINKINTQNHSFPIVAVDDLQHIVSFARNGAVITSGNDFSDSELISGEKVCIISETLARINGINVGDTLDLQYYDSDEALFNYSFSSINPSAFAYSNKTTPLNNLEKYTVVGIYQRAGEWADPEADMFAFTPNTIFVPKSSVSADMKYSHSGIFRSFIIENGMLLEFATAISDAGFDEQLLFDDNGYASVESKLGDYKELANKIIPLGAIVWATIMILFLILYPARQGKELDIMDSMGCNRRERISHIIISCLAILIPGSIVGTGIGALLWQVVVKILSSSDSALGVKMHALSFLLITVIQFILAVISIAIVALPLSRSRGLEKRR